MCLFPHYLLEHWRCTYLRLELTSWLDPSRMPNPPLPKGNTGRHIHEMSDIWGLPCRGPFLVTTIGSKLLKAAYAATERLLRTIPLLPAYLIKSLQYNINCLGCL